MRDRKPSGRAWVGLFALLLAGAPGVIRAQEPVPEAPAAAATAPAEGSDMAAAGEAPDMAAQIAELQAEAANTNSIGDGKIFVVNLEEAVRIRTKDRGNEAIG